MKNPIRVLVAACLAFCANPASALLRINEVHANPPGDDVIGTVGYEYIEIISTTGGVESTNTFKLLLMDTDGSDQGRVDAIWDLSGMATGTNGLLLLGINYASTGGGPWSGRIAPGTALGSITLPAGKDGLIEPNRAWSILLAQNYPGVVGSDISAADNILNLQFRNSYLRDSVGLNQHRSGEDPGAPPSPIANLSQLAYSPGSVSRLVGNTNINSNAAWFGAETTGASGTSTTFDPVRRFGIQANPAATPGAPNSPPAPADIRINEVAVNPPGADDNYEFIELLKVGGEATTGQGYHLLVVNTDNSSDTTCSTARSLGVIVEAWNLDQVEFGPNGLALIGNDYDDGLSPWRDHADPATVLSDIGSATDADGIKLGNDDIGNEIYAREIGVCQLDRTNAGFSLLLVKGFSGSALQDLDLDNDGILDATPWTSLVDSVGYAGLTPTYALVDLSQPGFQPDNISRKAGNTTGNSVAAFYGGSHVGDNPFHIGFGSQFFGGFRGQATPGRVNLSAALPPAPLVVNEVNFNPPGNAAEFFELKSTGSLISPAQGNSLLVVSTAAGNRGEVLHAYDLADFSTGPNGLLLMGADFENQANVIFPSGTVRPETAVENGPPGFVAGDLPDQDFAVLIATGFSGAAGTDLDADNNGVIDAGIGFTITDGFALGPLAHPAVTDLSGAGAADNVSRAGGITPGWYGGTIAGAQPGGLAYNTSGAFGPFLGTVTPGQGNHAAAPAVTPILINEANVNPPGADLNFDYVELISSGIKAQSTNDLTLLVIDTYTGADGLGNVGEITRVWNLDSLATGRNGLLLLGDGYTTSPPGAFASLKAALTATGDPVGMNADALASNDSIALVLVKGFSGSLGQDLDATNDGILDVTPWTQVVDAFVFGGTSDADFGLPELSQTGYRPDNLSRGGRPVDLVANSSTRWYGGAVVGATADSTAFDPTNRFDFTGSVGAPAATPGFYNLGGVLDDEVDNDLDGQVNLVEQAFATNPNLASSVKYPAVSLTQVGLQNHLAFAFSRRKGGSGTPGDYSAGGIRYLVQTSTNLGTWAPAGAGVVQASLTDDGNGLTETVVLRLTAPVTPGDPRIFIRLKASRL